MEGISPPLVTPFTEAGEIDEDKLRKLVIWVEERGVDFITPCGSNSEAELMTPQERKKVIDIVVNEASVPVLAGTGSPGFKETLEATKNAASAGADSSLIVTPFYYSFKQSELKNYFEKLADRSPIPIYLYSVPTFTNVTLDPITVADLADHPNIVGLKDSNANISEFIRMANRVENKDFELFIGSASVLVQALNAGGVGGVNAFANLYPEYLTEIYDLHQQNPAKARKHNAQIVELNTAITAKYGIPGLKWAMRYRGAPAGYSRLPHTQPTNQITNHLETLIENLENTTLGNQSQDQ